MFEIIDFNIYFFNESGHMYFIIFQTVLNRIKKTEIQFSIHKTSRLLLISYTEIKVQHSTSNNLTYYDV